jgi:hypothetical protein
VLPDDIDEETLFDAATDTTTASGSHSPACPLAEAEGGRLLRLRLLLLRQPTTFSLILLFAS